GRPDDPGLERGQVDVFEHLDDFPSTYLGERSARLLLSTGSGLFAARHVLRKPRVDAYPVRHGGSVPPEAFLGFPVVSETACCDAKCKSLLRALVAATRRSRRWPRLQRRSQLR